MDKSILKDVYRYWFGERVAADGYPEDRAKLWFKRSDETDRHIRDNFGAAIAAAAAADWDLAELTREEQVALVVLLDQFPRNIFRDSGEAFAYDGKARAIARRLIDGDWRRFRPAEQCFVLLPFEHSEDVADQDLAVRLYAERATTAPDGLTEKCRSELDYATKHRDLIRTFGRFPHRNAVLGRESTAEEAAFLKEKGRGF